MKKYLLPYTWNVTEGFWHRPTIDGKLVGAVWQVNNAFLNRGKSWKHSCCNRLFLTKEEAMETMDKMLVEWGYTIMPDKLITLL